MNISFVVLALLAVVMGIFWGAVLTGRLRPRQRPGVPARDPNLLRRQAAFYVASSVAILILLVGFLVFPDSVVLVGALMLPVWIVLLVVGLRVRADLVRASRAKLDDPPAAGTDEGLNG